MAKAPYTEFPLSLCPSNSIVSGGSKTFRRLLTLPPSAIRVAEEGVMLVSIFFLYGVAMFFPAIKWPSESLPNWLFSRVRTNASFWTTP